VAARTRSDSCAKGRLALLAAEDLEFELARAQLAQARMRAADRLLRCGDDLGLAALGFSRRHIATLRSSSGVPNGGYPDDALRAIGAHIRWLKAEVRRWRELVAASAALQGSGASEPVVDGASPPNARRERARAPPGRREARWDEALAELDA
jgi:hypothetical protein